MTDSEVQEARPRRRGAAGWIAGASVLLMAACWIGLASLDSDLSRQLTSARKDLRSLGADVRELGQLQKERNSYASVGQKMELVGQQRPRILIAMGVIAQSSPEGLWVGEMTYDDKGTLSLRGGCPDEGALGDFLAALEASPIFARVSLDDSTWSGQDAGNIVAFRASCVLNRVKLL